MNHETLRKPILKWVGGKTQILHHLLPKIPKEMNNYHELFLGGGSVLLAVLSLQKQGKIFIRNKIYASDVNKNLIHLYLHIQHDKDRLFEFIDFYIREYDSVHGTEINRNPTNITEAKTSKESYYYWIRKKYNKRVFLDKETNVECSALFLFLNKTCFRGVYREGKNGFNVPYGHYKKTPTIATKKDLEELSALIQNVEFRHEPFQQSIKNIQKGDFVYLDPPYAPENDNSFVDYVADGFQKEHHELLFQEIKGFQEIYFLMSNAKVPLVLDNFQEFPREDIVARRAINSKKPGSTTTEVIIYNVPDNS